jgi:hypothetical protein
MTDTLSKTIYIYFGSNYWRKRKLTLPNITLFTLPLQSIPSSPNIFKVDLFLRRRQIFRNLNFGFNFIGKEDCFFTSIGKYSDFYCPIKPNLTWPFSPFLSAGFFFGNIVLPVY